MLFFVSRRRSVGRLLGRPIWLACCLLGAGALLVAGYPVQAGGALPGDASAALTAMAQQQGGMRVLVALKVPWQAEGRLASPQAAQAQRNGIARAQDAFARKAAVRAARSVRRFDFLPYVAMDVDAATLAALSTEPDVASIVEDRAVPPLLAQTTSLIGADVAWARGYTGKGFAVAVLDSGIDSGHPFLAGKVVSEACYSTTSTMEGSGTLCPNGSDAQTGPGAARSCPLTLAGCEHGTHVAGIAAGKGTNYSGVAKDASLIGIQVFSQFTASPICGGATACILSYTSDQLAALERVYELRNTFRIAAVNMSLGSDAYTSARACDADPENGPIKHAIDNLRSVGIATVVAAGNEGYLDKLASPACLSSAISVGSTTKADVVSPFSNSAGWLSLLAPGGSSGAGIVSSVPGGGFAPLSGTSMASPQVVGAWAVLKSKAPWADVDRILRVLQTTGRPVTDTANGLVTPRIQLNAALDALPALDKRVYLPLVARQ